ncbi:MAG: glycosyltransferase [Cyanobacteria bacterium J06581_3]
MHHKNCHLWLPNIFEFKGGIQVYSAFLLQALTDLNQDAISDVFLKHDTKATFNIPSQSRFHFAGTYTLPWRTGIFTSQILTAGLIQRPGLIITTHLNFTPAAYLLKQLTGIPYWTVAHGVDAWNIQSPLLRRALRHADRILPVSSYTRDRLLKEQNLNPNQLSVLPNTFDSQRWQISPKPQYLLDRYRLNSQQPVILTVGRLDASEGYKGYDQILNALPKIQHHFPDVHYVLVGKGSDRPRVEKIIEDLNLQSCVTLPGFIPDEELGDHYNLCDVFAMPSKGEGFGIVYLEALACGKPCLGGNQDGAIDALCHGDLGALVNPDDTDEIAQTLIQILQGTYPNALLYQPQALRQQVIETYGFEKFKQTLAGYL